MEQSYNQMGHDLNTSDRGNFFAYLTPTLAAPLPNSGHHHHMDMNTFIHLQSSHPDNYFHSPEHYHHHAAAVKREGVAGSSHHQPLSAAPRVFHNYHLSTTTDLGMRGGESSKSATDTNSNKKHYDDFSNNNNNCGGGDEMEAMKAKIIAHPQYSNLLEAFMDCQKVGAPPEVSAKLSAIRHEFENRQTSSFVSASKDPELDQFMEAYYDMLVKYKEELTRPVQEAMEFMHRIESQLNLLSNGHARIINSDERSMGRCSSEELEAENSGGDTEVPGGEIDPRAEDRELKNHLLKKYSGYLSSLKQELSKKKKKGKLPKEARHKLLSWWELHYKWPYPSESEKVALAEATGLDQKQINNWFINQRKRHWKPSEDMQFMVMDGLHHHHPHAHNAAAAAAAASFYMEGHHYMGDHPPYRFGT